MSTLLVYLLLAGAIGWLLWRFPQPRPWSTVAWTAYIVAVLALLFGMVTGGNGDTT